jgi:folate-binding protein YgfZ
MMRPRPSVCSRCLSRSKQFSTTANRSNQSQNASSFPPQTGYSRLTNRGLISITGTDSTTFLQGLMTQNMLVSNDPSRKVRRTGAYTAFLNSQGRVLNDAFIYPIPGAESNDAEQSWLVEVDKNQVPVLMKHLKKHKLRAKLKLRALEEGERTVWSTWKNHSEPRWAAYSLESESPSPFSPTSQIAACLDSRAPAFGSRIITPGSDGLRTHLPDEAQVAGSEVELDSYTVRRFLHGVAEGQSEIISGSALPLQCNMDMARGIDFRKGCYVGQELTIRTHHRGVTRKRILPVQLYDMSQDVQSLPETLTYDPSVRLTFPTGESDIVKAGTTTRRNRSAGTFLNGIGNIGLALCRLEVMTDVALMGETPARPHEQQFKLTWAPDVEQPNEVGVRAFVPPWLRDFISGAKEEKPAPRNPEAEGERARELVEQLEQEEDEAEEEIEAYAESHRR